MIWLQPGQDGFDRVASALAHAIGDKLDGIDHGTVAAVIKGDRLQGAFAVTNWRPRYGTAELHAAGGKGWVSREAMRDLMDYVFQQLGVSALIMRTDADNTAVTRVLRRHGLEEATIPHARGLGRPEAVFVLTRDAASRFLGD